MPSCGQLKYYFAKQQSTPTINPERTYLLVKLFQLVVTADRSLLSLLRSILEVAIRSHEVLQQTIQALHTSTKLQKVHGVSKHVYCDVHTARAGNEALLGPDYVALSLEVQNFKGIFHST